MARILLCEDKEFIWKSGDLHTNFGLIKGKDILSGNLKSNTGKEFIAYDASFSDLLRYIHRGPATITPKDAAYICYYTGVNKTSKVVDAGAGCGILSASLGRIAKEVTSYELNPEFLKIAKKNLDFLGVDNVKLKNNDIYGGIEEKNLDLVTLDLPEPWHVFKYSSSLKEGGWLVTYLPTIVQVMAAVEESKKNNLLHVKTIELLEREWHIEGRKVRPKSAMIAHTAFLSFFRKV